MHIYIDESGNFIRRPDGGPSISTIGALVLRDTAISGFEKLYGRLRTKLPKDRDEVKGRLLTESQILEVCKILKKVGAIFQVTATDLSLQSDADVERHQKIQAEKITENVTDEFTDSQRDYIFGLRNQLEKMSPQLYLQAVLLTDLIYGTLEIADMYHSLRWPKELGEYHWVIDAKGANGQTNWEKWWEETLLPMLESKSVRKPLAKFELGDYSAQARYMTSPSEYKSTVYGINPAEDYLDLRKVMKEDLRFSSKAEFGLEAVDILTNAIRRSLNGNLQRNGWLPIRELMIHRKGQYFSLVSLGPEMTVKGSRYNGVLKDFESGGRTMLTPALLRD